MGNRLSKIYTRTGDEGMTGLGTGTRVRKDSMRIEVIGDVDELNSLIGMILAWELPQHPTSGILARDDGCLPHRPGVEPRRTPQPAG